MSSNDFQTKYSSVMESMLKSAVAETTKLFETMVDELKAEICRMKKENEDLKTRCSQFENERRQPAVYTGETGPLPGPSDGSQKRDRAIQCDLVPVRTVLVEQCQPLRHTLQNENQHWGSEQMEYSLQDHTYGEGTTQMAFILVKQEASYDDSCPEPILKQEEAEPTVVCELVLSSPRASVCRTENKGSLINQEYSTEELPFPQTNEDADVTLELPCLGMDSCLQGVQNQSSELENSLVISLAVVKDNMEEESAVSQISEMQGELIASDKQPLVVAQHQPEFESLEKEQLSVIDQQCQIEGVTSVDDQADVTQQKYTDVQSNELQLAQPTPLGKGEACEGLKSGVAEDGASFQPQPEITIQPRRGRPPKKAKQLQQSRKENGSPAVSVAFLSKRCSSEKQKLSESQQISLETKKGAVQASSEGSSATVAVDTCTVESRERRTSVTLQDAMLLVEAMNQSTVENTLSSPQRVAAQLKIQCAPCVGTLETVEEVPHEPQTPPISVKSVEAAGSLPITELSATCQSNIEKVGAAPVTADAPPTNERPTQVKVVIVKQLHTAAQSSTTTPSMPSSTAAVKKKLQSVQQRSPGPLITSVAPDNAISDNMSRSASSLIHHKIAALSPTQLPTVVSTVAAQKESIPPDSATAGMPLGAPSLSSVPQKEILVASGKLLPVVHSQLSATSANLHSGPPPRPQITIIVPRKMPASRKQNIVRTTLPVSTQSAAPVTVSSPQLISSSQETSIYTQTVLDEVASLSSPRKDQTTNNMESPKQTAAALESINGPTETCSSLNMSVGPVPTSMLPAKPLIVEQKLSAVVRLTRLPFPVSAKGVILISKLPPDGFSQSQSIVTQEKLSSMIKTEESSEALMLSSDFSPNLKETSVASSNSVGEIISFDCASPNDPPTEGQSATLLHLTTVTTKDKSDPHIQMNKAQFLAQLAVTPVTQDPEEASPIDSVDALASCAEMSTSEKKRLQKKSLVAQLRCHLKTRLQARRTKINPEPCTETEPSTVNPKKQRLDNDSPNNNNSTTGPSPLSLKYPEAVVSSPKKTSNDPAPISPRRSGVEPNKNFCELSYVRFKPTRKSTPVSPNFGPDGVCSKTKKSASVSPRRSTPVKESASPKKKNSASVSSRRSNSTTQSASSKKTNNISVSTRKISSTRDGASPKNGARSKSTKNTPVSPKRTSSGAIPKKTKSTVSPRTSSLSKNGTSPKVSTIESTSFCRRRCTLTKNGSSSKQTKDSNSFSPRYSTTTHGSSAKNTKSETVSPSVSRRKTRESTPAKKPRLIKDSASPKQTLTIIDAKKLTKVAKVNVIAKMKNSSRSKLQNEGAMGQLAANHTSCEAGRKFTAKAVWTPPRLSASKTPPAVSKKEASPPRSQDSVFIFPPSVSLRPIPVRAPPVVSPLQPLSVIGRRLLKNQCGECGRVLSSVAALESHVSLHAGRRPFSCTLCGKRFPDSKGLKRHGRVHRNGRIHICQQCGKGFVYRFGLTKHLQMVHRKIKPFICQICNKGFFTKRDVEAHIRIHTGEKPFHCNLCEKKFARRVELNVHLRWHNGEKRHWCPYCGKGFLDFNNLKRHKYIHTGEKPHSCPHCAKNFTQSGHLKKHVKNVHKIV